MRRRWSCGRRRCGTSRGASGPCSSRRAWRNPRGCSWMPCSGRSGARRAGCERKPRVIPVPGASRPCSAARCGRRMLCAIACAIMRLRPSPSRMPCWSSTRRGSSSRAGLRVGSGANTRARRARSPTVRSACSPPMCRAKGTPSSTGPSTFLRTGPRTPLACVQRTCRRRSGLQPSPGLRSI